MKQICAASLTLALAVVASGCNTNDLPDRVRTLPDKQDGKMTIHAATGQQSDTRVAYEDGAAGMDGKLTWQTGDRLTVVRMKGGSCVNYADDYQYNGTDGATSGPFTGTAISNAGDSWTIYSPHTVTVNTSDGTATLPMTGQTQTADGSTSHLRNYLLLSSEGIADLSADFTLAMKGSIMKFDLSNVPAEVGKLTKLVWTVETTGGTRCLTLRFAPGAVTFADGKRTLTAYLAFMPGEMAVKAGGKFTVTLTGDKTYRAETTIDGGKTYAAGMRYTAAIDGNSSMSWEEKAVMALTVKVSDDNLSFNIPFPESGNTPAELTVDWGDDTPPTTVASGTALSSNDDFNHTYAAAGTYTLTIMSGQTDKTQQQIPSITFDQRANDSNALKLISIDTPLLNTQAMVFSRCFFGCTSLSSIPSGLFDNNTLATNFGGCFGGCTSLSSIPSGLFDKNTLATNFGSCFSGCTSLSSIPTGLFKNTLATSFNRCFSGCTSLSSIPTGLFDNNTQATDFRFCFSACHSLSSIPAGLFDKNTRVTNFGHCFGGCTSLSSIPSGLFDNNTRATEFNACFSGCTSLSSIPTGLFDKNTLVVTFSTCFDSCTSLSSIPAGLFDNNTLATNFDYCFSSCTSLSSIPSGLFDNNTLATNFDYCFSGCSILVLNENIFSAINSHDRFSGKKMSFSYCFENVGKLLSPGSGGTAPDLWSYDKGGASWTTTDCFANATHLSNYASIPTAWGGVASVP